MLETWNLQKRNISYFTQWLLDKIETAMKQETGVTFGESAWSLPRIDGGPSTTSTFSTANPPGGSSSPK